MAEITIRDMARELESTLAAAGIDAGEAKAMSREIIERIKGYTAVDIAINGHRTLLDETAARMRGIANRVAKGEPLQYALGCAYFRGRDFKVTPATLIPRPETAGLVDLVEDALQGRRGCKLLDIGTGTGCIAISLALDLAYSDVTAIDISAPALAVAKENAKALKASVDFMKADALNLADSPLCDCKFDAIVSNPPYVMDSEKSGMESRVADHEPASALFVPDTDPLIFYRAIAQYALSALDKGGSLFFEINPLCAKELESMLTGMGFSHTDIIRDYKGNLRFAIARLD